MYDGMFVVMWYFLLGFIGRQSDPEKKRKKKKKAIL